MSTLFQIRLKSVLVKENGKIEEDEKGVNALAATLYYPKEGVPAVSSTRELKLEDDKELNYFKEPPQKQLLFKEIVKGNSTLEVEISAIEKVTKFQKIIWKVMTAGATAAVGAAVGGMAAFVSGIINTSTESLFELAEPNDKISVIGRGSMPIDENTPEGDFVVQLSVPKELTLFQRKLNDRGEFVDVKMKIPKGYSNAMVVFDIAKL